jgi:hypothetical protein
VDMANNVKPLDPKEATLDIDTEVVKHLGKGPARTLEVEKFGAFPGKQSRRIAFNIVLRRSGREELQKHPVVLRVSSRDARQLARLFAQAADAADGIA